MAKADTVASMEEEQQDMEAHLCHSRKEDSRISNTSNITMDNSRLSNHRRPHRVDISKAGIRGIRTVDNNSSLEEEVLLTKAEEAFLSDLRWTGIDVGLS
jgi:hypothetical protein